jgi:hypothetical protein
VALFVERTWTGVHVARAYLVDDADLEIAVDANLARESNVRRELGFHREAIAFEFSHFAGLTFEELDAASRATSVTAAAVKNVDTGVFEYEHQFLAFGASISTGPVAVSALILGICDLLLSVLDTKGTKATKGTKKMNQPVFLLCAFCGLCALCG